MVWSFSATWIAFSPAASLLSCAWITLSISATVFIFTEKNISVKMNRTALISNIRKDFRNVFKHTVILIANDQAYTSKPAFFQPYEERTPAFTILFSPFRSAKDLPAAIMANIHGNESRNVLDLAAPAALQVNTIYVNIGVIPGKKTCAPVFDV